MTQEVLKLALDYLESRGLAWNVQIALREALREHALREVQRLGQEIEQEPVAWWNDTGTHIDLNVSGRGTPLYTYPPQRTWVGLTIEEIAACCRESTTTQLSFAQELEAKLKERNT